MPYRDWSRIEGPVTACFEFDSARRFDSLVEALHWHDRSPYYPPYPRVRHYLDEYGMIIPQWKIDEVARLNPRPRWRAAWRRLHPHVHRQGPVPGIRHSWRFRFDRHIGTYPAIRDGSFLESDPDAREYGIKERGRRRHLPTDWDDLPRRRRSRGWKAHRQNQWK